MNNTVNLNEAIRIYRSSDHVDEESCSCFAITPRLAAGQKLNEQQEELVKALADGIASQEPLTEAKRFFRGTCSSFLTAHIGEGRFVYKPFISATSLPIEATHFFDKGNPTLISLVAPAGCRVLKISDPAVACLEKEEVLFPKELTISVDEVSWEQWSDTLKSEDLLALGLKCLPHKIMFLTLTIHSFEQGIQ